VKEKEEEFFRSKSAVRRWTFDVLFSLMPSPGGKESSMFSFLKSRKFKAVLIGIAAVILLILYSFFVADTVETRITDAQMTKVDGRYMIATEYRPFVNYDVWYRFKFNSGTVQNEAVRLKGKVVKIKKYGWRMPFFSRYENVVKIEEVK
jgi:hypothetical protein